MLTLNSVDELISYIGKETGKSPWVKITQEKINEFAKSTQDFQWIHVDEEKAKNGPFGSTIAHGFLTLSLAPWMSYNTYEVKNLAHSLNYGVDKVRFISPVKADSNLRGTFKLLEVNPTKGGGYKIKNQLTIEIEGQDKPACIAETLGVIYPS
ncbi:MAG: dehydratase [Rickettsiales bacterium]|nr:dehydratase [Pelagibacterales bacterium]MBT35425.1 dehydratase [Rickettsiales bacterium]|tara:strand:- start:3313 stop:3771 length:459 start_codon:yes stop_codon:yes gene_type:complete